MNKIKNCNVKQPVHLILDGGSARAFAHIGILRVFEIETAMTGGH